MEVADLNKVRLISSRLEKELGTLGFEFQPFKVGWYNSTVASNFRLNYDDECLAFLIISTPRMFENCFIPFVKEKAGGLSGFKDPIDECMTFHLSKIQDILPEVTVKVVHDFELHPNRRPKLIFQTIAHISGTAYFYHTKDIKDETLVGSNQRKVYGVCMHPKYGGWFALRAVAFLENLSCPDLPRTWPLDVVPSQKDRTTLLELYNFHWEDWRFRDIVKSAERYSELQIKYFSTKPGNRQNVIKEILGVS